MKKVAVEDAEREAHAIDVNAERRLVSAALGTTDFALVYYELEPGDSFSEGYHTHHDQEEVFYVLEGTATFKTEEGHVPVGAGEAIRFAPGEFQYGYNGSDARVAGLAFGAPGAEHDWEEIESLYECPACGEDTRHTVEPIGPDEGIRSVCVECGTEEELR